MKNNLKEFLTAGIKRLEADNKKHKIGQNDYNRIKERKGGVTTKEDKERHNYHYQSIVRNNKRIKEYKEWLVKIVDNS